MHSKVYGRILEPDRYSFRSKSCTENDHGVNVLHNSYYSSSED